MSAGVTFETFMDSFIYTVRVSHGLEQTPISASAPAGLVDRLARAGITRDVLARSGAATVHLHLTGQDWSDLNLGALVAAALARPTARIDGGREATAWVGGAHSTGMLKVTSPRAPTVALVDRDGTIIEDRHYLSDPDEVTLLPGAAAGLRRLAQAGVRLVVISNQSGVARGKITPAQLAAVNRRMNDLLAAEMVTLDGILVCPHAPEDDCPCRKPREGLAREAAGRLGLDLAAAIVVGDKPADVGLARRLGVPAFLVGTGDGAATLRSRAVSADYAVENLEAVARICCHPGGIGLLG